MGKKKSSRFSLLNVLPTAWFSKLTRRERARSGQSASTTCLFPSPCNGGKLNSELSLPRFSIGERRFGAFDEYLRNDEHEPPRSSCGSCRLSVSAADVPPIFSEMLTDAHRAKAGKGNELPFPEPIVLSFKQNRLEREVEERWTKRDTESELDGVAEELPAKNSCNFYGGRGVVDLTFVDPILPQEIASAVDVRSRNRSGFRNGNRSSTCSVPLPETERRRSRGGSLGADRSKVGDFPGQCSLFMPEGDVCKVDKGKTEPVVRTKKNAVVHGVPFSSNNETCPVKDSVQFPGTKTITWAQDGMSCSVLELDSSQKCRSFPGEPFRVFPEKELFENAATRKEAEEVTTRCINTGVHFSSGKPNRFPSLSSVLFPETECSKTIPSVEMKSSQSEFTKTGASKSTGAESMLHKKMDAEFPTMKCIGEANNFPNEEYSSSVTENCHAFMEMGSKRSHQRQMTRIGPEDVTDRKFGDSRTTGSFTFLDKARVKKVSDVKDAIELLKSSVQSVKVNMEHVPMTQGQAKGVPEEAHEAELLSRSSGYETPRRKSFKVRRKTRNGKIIGCDTGRFPNEPEGSQREDSQEDLELKISKILGFDPGTLHQEHYKEEGAKFDLNYVSRNSDYRNSACKQKTSPVDRYSPNDPTLFSRKSSDRKIGKGNEFKSLLLRKLDRKKSELVQNSRNLRPQRDPEATKPKQRPKIRVSSPRVEIRPRKSFQGDRRKKEKAAAASFAVVKRSLDPQEDFRESMVEMISQNRIARPEDLENLLASYLSLNSDEHHDVIVKVFRQVWFDIRRSSLVSDYIDLEGNPRVRNP